MTTSPTQTAYTATRVRREFIDFFRSCDHAEVPSGPVFPQDDPTLLFTNAGMNQFKDVFLGAGTRSYRRATDTQKCIRVSGKHNDLEEVGRDTYHHTFFEMLGNWSFGDYFKEEAIVWAWQLLTEVWGLPKERLWVTVFGGDEADGLGADEEAERIWFEKTDIDRSHVLRFDRTDNFWEMGDTGPCGPCSEIHIDRGPEGCDLSEGANTETGVNAGNERFIELWNLVFMQFNRLDDGKLVDLPAKSVDTGMGFERILSVLQGKSSNYDTDLFQPIFSTLQGISGKPYGSSDEEANVAFRVCADHIRAVSCALADGALPSNEGRGYVLRRLIRRASRFGRQVLGLEDPFLFQLVPTVAEILGDTFPEVRDRVDHLQLVVRAEEEAFRKTLDRGLRLFERLADELARSGTGVLPGKEAYELYATYGFPRDLVELMGRERGLTVDEAGWDEAQAAHREISKSEGKFKQLLSAEEMEGLPPTESTYHGSDDRSGQVETEVVFADLPAQGSFRVVLRESPFYPEAGGQVGDSGRLEAQDGSVRLTVEETRKVGNLVVHIGPMESSQAPAGTTLVGTQVKALVDTDRRDLTRKNHSATHLMHKALRIVLGEHVGQQGSYVGPDRLRFDFSNPSGVTAEQLASIEDIVNEQVMANGALNTTVEDLEAAKARGVVALFGEKYDERVRVVDLGGWSTELCGGTHVSAGGDIGPFVIVSERAISAGVRRIEAVTGPGALEFLRAQRNLVLEVAGALKARPEEVPERLAALQKQVKDSKKKAKQSAGADLGAVFARVKEGLGTEGGVTSGVVDCPDLDGTALRELGDRLQSLSSDLALAVFGRDGAKVPFVVLCRGKALDQGLKAGALAKIVSGHLGGGGGGRPETAQGQGMQADAVPAAIDALSAAIRTALDG